MPAITHPSQDMSFVGREACLLRLRERWRDSRAGRARLVMLVGEAGVGKTSLAGRFAEEVHAGGGVVIYGRADEDALLPHQPFVSAVRSLLSYGGEEFAAETAGQRDILSRLIPDIRQPWDPAPAGRDLDALRFALFEAVADLFTRASGRWPLLLVLDDLHWADKPTLLLLRHLLREPRLAHLLVIGTFRDVEVGRDHALVDLLSDLRRERRLDRIALGGLDAQSTRTLVGQRLGRDVTPCFIRRLLEQTEGNAFFIDETVRALVESDLPADEVVTEDALERLGVPEGVAEVIARRVGRLSALAADVLTGASVIGRDFRMGLVEQLVEASTEQIMAALEECIAAGLVVEVAERIDVFAFSHALVREVLYSQLTTSRRVRMHHRVGVGLEAIADREEVNPAELAHHFQLASHFVGTEPGRRYAILAGHRATELLAYEEACGHFRRALALFDDAKEAERCDVLLALGRVQWHAGDDDARQTFMAAADSASRRGAADQLARAALGFGERWFETEYVGSRYRELMEEAVAALADADNPLRALLLARLAEHVGYPYEQDRAIALSAEALRIARRLDDENVLIATMLARHVTLSDARHLDERLALSDEIVSLREGHREMSAEHRHWRIHDLLSVGDVERARDEQRRLEAVAEELRQPLFHALAVGWRAVWAELEGDVELAERCAETSLRHEQRAHMKDALAGWAARLVMIRRRQQRLGELTPVVEQLAHSSTRERGWRSVLALILAETGEEVRARTIYESELAGGVDSLPRGLFWLPNVTVLGELCVLLGDGERAESLYIALAPYAHRNVVVGYASCWGPVEGYMGRLAETFGDRALAAQHLHSARKRTRALGAPLLTAALEREPAASGGRHAEA